MCFITKRSYFLITFLLALVLLTGCGGGAGSSSGSSADSILADQIIGTWEISQETVQAINSLKPVQPNASNKITTVTFNSNNTGILVDYEIYTDHTLSYWQTKDIPGVTSKGNWAISNGELIRSSSEGSYSVSITISGDTLTETTSDGDVTVWIRV